jgi:hypothetical protein
LYFNPDMLALTEIVAVSCHCVIPSPLGELRRKA